MFPGIWHREEPGQESGWNEHFLGFYGEVARRMLGRSFFSPKQPVIKIRHEEALLELYTNAIGAVKTNQPALQQVLAGIGLNILGIVYSDQHSKNAGDDRSLALMHTAVTTMRETLTSPLDLEKLARDLGMSYTSFRHRFAHHTGLSPHQYLFGTAAGARAAASDGNDAQHQGSRAPGRVRRRALLLPSFPQETERHAQPVAGAGYPHSADRPESG